MNRHQSHKVELIPVDSIEICNPRVRNKRVFRDIIRNIGEIGLKRPVTVSRRIEGTSVHYDLVCGQGRLEAFRALGQTKIPAVVVDATEDDCLVMSLVENIARRHRPALDHLREIKRLKDQGYEDAEVSEKIGLSAEYLRAILKLLKDGEYRLLLAVERGIVPVSVAIQIASHDDEGIQRILQDAYEKNILRGRKFAAVKKLVSRRKRSGKGDNPERVHRVQSVERLLQTYKEDSDMKLLMVRKAELTRDRLLFSIEALRTLFADDNFVTLLRAERLETIPKNLLSRLHAESVR